ncbi:hypothetical protein BC829DRAFT_378771 [Chytridium lagenaria]|nr:hypothetical protein BC829DRAFT_378771 [Chytridium lagenaria]
MASKEQVGGVDKVMALQKSRSWPHVENEGQERPARARSKTEVDIGKPSDFAVSQGGGNANKICDESGVAGDEERGITLATSSFVREEDTMALENEVEEKMARSNLISAGEVEQITLEAVVVGHTVEEALVQHRTFGDTIDGTAKEPLPAHMIADIGSTTAESSIPPPLHKMIPLKHPHMKHQEAISSPAALLLHKAIMISTRETSDAHDGAIDAAESLWRIGIISSTLLSENTLSHPMIPSSTTTTIILTKQRKMSAMRHLPIPRKMPSELKILPLHS